MKTYAIQLPISAIDCNGQLNIIEQQESVVSLIAQIFKKTGLDNIYAVPLFDSIADKLSKKLNCSKKLLSDFNLSQYKQVKCALILTHDLNHLPIQSLKKDVDPHSTLFAKLKLHSSEATLAPVECSKIYPLKQKWIKFIIKHTKLAEALDTRKQISLQHRLTDLLNKFLVHNWLTLAIEPVTSGYSNYNFKLITATDRYFIKLCQEGHFKDLRNEANILKAINDNFHMFNIHTPNLKYIDDESQSIVLEYVEGRSLTRQDIVKFKPITEELKKFHSLVPSLDKTFDYFDLIFKFLKQLKEIKDFFAIEILQNINLIQESIDKIQGAMQPYLKNNQPVFCHNDLHCGNFLLSQKQIYIIDVETAGYSYRLFDLATLASTEELTESQMQALLKSYDQNLTKDFKWFWLARIIVDAYFYLWCLERYMNTQIFSYLEISERYIHSFKEKRLSHMYLESI
ncbi:MAG: hypothetical protein K0S74_1049 [Chlamydiales bacterium]|jgi:thiamine kinase-like enzyme|nr:hypothetical protein [Chlamydiales bacterium]